MLPLCATGQSRVHYCCGSPQYKRELIVFSMIDTLGLNANLFNLWLELIALMEVNLVFSNHPETRKEVLHFYDYSSRECMLPILHTGDSICITLCVVGVVGCAPTRHYWQQILSLSRLLSYDIPPYKRHYRSSHAYLPICLIFLLRSSLLIRI